MTLPTPTSDLAKPAASPLTPPKSENLTGEEMASSPTKAKRAKPAKEVLAPIPKKMPAPQKVARVKTTEQLQPVAAKDARAKKPKLVRDSFTIPKDEYAVIETLKQRASALAHPVKKSELLRAGLKVLASLSDIPLSAALKAVPSIKTGRPKAHPKETTSTVSPKVQAKSVRK